MTGSISLHNKKTVVGFSTTTGIILYGGFGAAGVVVGYFLPQIAAWALKLPWVPFEGPLKLVNYFSGIWVNLLLALLGLIVGLVVAAIAVKELLVVTITDEEVQLDKDGHKQTIVRKEIDTVFLDGKQLVILGKSGHELARDKIDESPSTVMDAFKSYDYSWSTEGDPFKHEYKRWVLDTPDLSTTANALMKAREIALQKKDAKDGKELRNELIKLGYIVREEETRQYWRKVRY
ncbi:YqeB family protein [Brevibacillus reuszeri]|uniref:YqeB family protein n=1 Tax=Brevibacillus reuszeri TaxID=54915 RepID=UPI003D21D39A